MCADANCEEYSTKKKSFWGEPYLQTENALSLKTKALFFFFLTILLTLVAVADVLYESTNHWVRVLPTDSSSGTLVHENIINGDAGIDGVTRFFPVLLTGSLVLLLFTLIVGMIFLLRNIIIPLENIADAVRRINEGHLDKSIPIQAKDEIGHVIESINDMSVNMQEILLYIWNNNQQNFKLIDSMEEQLNKYLDNKTILSQLKKDIARIRQNNEEVQTLVTTFNYFEVKLEHEKMVSDPGQDNTASNF